MLTADLTTRATASTTPTTSTTAPTTSIMTATASKLAPLTTFDKTSSVTTKPVATFTCANNVCTGTGATSFLFQTFQGLINMALARIGKVGFINLTRTIPVDGRITQTTVDGFLPVSRAVGGTLAIFDIAATPQLLATNALSYAQGIAQWLGITWVEATSTVAGHWERLPAGQTAVLPKPPTTTAPTTLCPPGTIATSRGCVMTAPPPPTTAPTSTAPTSTAPTTPTAQPSPSASSTPSAPSVTLCPPGTIATSQGCLATQSSTPAPSVQPGPLTVPEMPDTFTPAPTKLRYAGCIARFNKTRRVFAIYCPISSPAAGLGRAGMFAGYTGLGADTVTPPPPAGFVKTAEVTTLPGAGETPAGEEKDKFFRINNPGMWIAIVGTVAAVGGGGYWLMRRRTKPAGFGSELFGLAAV